MALSPEVEETLKQFGQECVDEVRLTLDYEALKRSLMRTEVLLGEYERHYDCRNPNHGEFIDALDDIWGQVCKKALEKAIQFAEDSPSFAGDLNLPAAKIMAALNDNYVFGALAAVFAAARNKEAKAWPVLAEAAFNKNRYVGFQDEIACLRMLLWAGFDPNAQDEQGRTALHFMASLKNLPGSHPRAVRLLLKAGIDPNLKNEIGDTALCYMAGNESWLDAMDETAWMLLRNGANPLLKANDGSSAYTLWKQKRNYNQDIDELVSAIESVMAESQA